MASIHEPSTSIEGAMPSTHEHSRLVSSPILSCCAAHLNIDATNSPLDDTIDGATDQPKIKNKVWQPAMGKEAVQSPITIPQKRVEQSKAKPSDKKAATAISKPAQGNTPSSEKAPIGASKTNQSNIPSSKKVATTTSKPAQDNVPSSKSARKPSAKRVSLEAPPKAERNPRTQHDAPDDFSAASSGSSDDNEPDPTKLALKSTANKSDRKPPTKKPLRNSTPKKDRKETVVNDFGSITLGAPRLLMKGHSILQFTGFSDKMASKLGKEIAQFLGAKGVSKERAWGFGYEFQLRGDPWGGRKSQVGSTFAVEYLGQQVGDGGSGKEEIFLRHMFGVMHKNGYSLQLANQAIIHGTFFFKKSPGLAKGAAEIITISFHDPNRLRFTCAPEGFLEAVKELLEEHPRFKGERKKTQKIKEGKPKSAEYKVPGVSWQPWHGYFKGVPEKRMKVTKARVIKLQLMEMLEDQGWKAIFSTDKSITGPGGEVDHVGNAWYYYRDRNTLKEKGLESEGSKPQKSGAWKRMTGKSV
jgi:hypothetical protein